MPDHATDHLNPLQARVYHELFALGQPRPQFDAGLAAHLRRELRAALAPLLERLELGGRWLHVNKHALARVHTCERHHVGDRFTGWSPASARGTIAHQAIELAVHTPGEVAPLDATDMAIDRIRSMGGEWSPREWLERAPPVELAELRAAVNERVTKFLDCFPPLAAEWRPNLEWSVNHQLEPGVVVLNAKIDLKLGRPRPHHTAGVLFVDFKTGRPYPTHADDLRWYALVETLRSGVPPFRVASYYLDSGTWHHEDVDDTLLAVALRRAADGIAKLAELELGEREPTATPGPACRWCGVRDGCDVGTAWSAETDAEAHADDAEPGEPASF